MGRRAIEQGPSGRNVQLNVKRLRAAQRLTTRQLANQLTSIGRPIDATGITHIEKGRRRVDVDELVALAAVLKVEPAQLLAPWDCHTCHGAPAAGFVCALCGSETPDA